MKYDVLGRAYCSEDDLVDLIYKNPTLDLSNVFVIDPKQFNYAVKNLSAEFPLLKKYGVDDAVPGLISPEIVQHFDQKNQSNWFMPAQYQQMDIAKWLLDQCQTDVELQRVAQELLLYQERDLMSLLKFLKYLVDTLRKNNIVWGVGRGSSVSSYVLYLIGIHKINSIYYDLDITEFLK